MNYNEMYQLVKDLKVGEKLSIFKKNKVEIYLIRPEKKFKEYDVKKNFQIFIKEEEREFRPNHLRCLLDLNLRIRSRPDLKTELALAFDKIFFGGDPLVCLKKLEVEDFEHSLNEIMIVGILHQLFLIEQDYNYNKESMYEPKTLFLQGWVRASIDNLKEIDNLAMSVCSYQPPAVKYTCKDNKKHKKYDENSNELWYLEEEK